MKNEKYMQNLQITPTPPKLAREPRGLSARDSRTSQDGMCCGRNAAQKHPGARRGHVRPPFRCISCIVITNTFSTISRSNRLHFTMMMLVFAGVVLNNQST